MSKKLLVGALSILTAATAFGCASTPTTPQATTTNTAQVADRSVMAVGENPAEVAQAIKELPARISVADADKLLTTIDPSQVKDEARHVNVRFGGYGGIGMRGVGYRGLGRVGAGWYGRFGLGHGYRFFGHGRRYFPYYRYGSYFYPYSSYGYYPYLTTYSNYCYPYSYWY